MAELETGCVRLGGSQTIGTYLMPKLIRDFKTAFPRVAVQLRIEPTRQVCQAVAAGDLDIAIVGGEIPPAFRSHLQVRTFKWDELVLVVAASHPLASSGRIEREALQKLAMVSINSCSTVYAMQEAALLQHGIRLASMRPDVEANSVEAVKSVVREGLGAAFLSRTAVERELEEGSLAIVRIDGITIERPLRIVTNQRRYMSVATKAIYGQLLRAATGSEADGDGTRDGTGTQLLAASPTSMNQADALDGGDTSISTARIIAKNERRDQTSARDSTAEIVPGMGVNTGRSTDPRVLAMTTTDTGAAPGSDESTEAGGAPVYATPPSEKLPNIDLRLLQKLPFSLVQLSAFRLVATLGSFNSAAEAMFVSQPFISSCVSKLERSLGVKVIERQAGRGACRVTEEGSLLLRYTQAIFSLGAECLGALADVDNVEGGTVCLGASQTTGTYLMPRLISMFSSRYPTVNVQLRVDISRRVCRAVAGGDLDAAIIGGEVPAELAPYLQVIPYSQDELVLVVSPQHPIARQKRAIIDIEDLYDLTFISPDENSSVRQVQESLLMKAGIQWQFVIAASAGLTHGHVLELSGGYQKRR
ncbi:unnamed protein product [Pedinophyceae sp. YPF-701]|nr:unnamed protein product [Pedinophyceae sp. YPF-701]